LEHSTRWRKPHHSYRKQTRQRKSRHYSPIRIPKWRIRQSPPICFNENWLPSSSRIWRKKWSQQCIIIAGDYNTGINHVDQVGKSFWYEDELIKLKKNGYVDAFRHIHGDIKEYSWYSHQGNGYRYDHTYVDEALIPIVKDCYYLNSWREEKLSDHSPMVLELG